MVEKIVFYSDKGGFFGGVERFIFQAAQSLRAAGVRCCGVFAERAADADRFSAAFDEISFQPSSLDSFCRDADWLWIHKCGDCRILQALSGRTRTAFYVHDHDYYCFRRHKYWPVSRENCPLPCRTLYCLPCGSASRGHARWTVFRRNLSLVRDADLVFAGSDFMLDNLRMNRFDSGRLKKLPPLIELPGNGAAEQTEKKENELVYVGQVIRGKGVDLLLSAAALLSSDYHLTVAGEGGDLEFCRSLAGRLGIGSRVSFAGFHTEVGEFYGRASVAVFPSRWQEPFGMTGPEAMSFGVPVVGFDVGGVREWLSDGVDGLLVRAGDVNALAEALDRLLKDRRQASVYGANAKERMRRFTPGAFAGNVLRHLEEASLC